MNNRILFKFVFMLLLLFIIGAKLVSNFYLGNLFCIESVWVNICSVLWLISICYALLDVRRRVVYFLFSCTFFIFLMYRPVLGYINGGDWIFSTLGYGASTDSVLLALQLMATSLFFIFLGVLIGEFTPFPANTNTILVKLASIGVVPSVRRVSLFLFLISLSSSIFVSLEAYFFVAAHDYLSYYSEFASRLPYPITVIARFSNFFLVIYLCCLPKRKLVFMVLSLWVLATIPYLLMGLRNPFVLAVLFSLVYFVMRDEVEGHWSFLSKKESIAIIIGLMILFVLITFVRGGNGSIADFLYKQGVSFAWLSAGLNHIDDLRATNVMSYSFGPFFDYWNHNKIVQFLFGATTLSSNNSLEQIEMSQIMAHHLSYTLLGERYLQGNGTGSSYLLELFTDFGFVGVGLFSILLGLFMGVCSKRYICSFLCFFLVLMTIQGILFMPRAEVLSAFIIFTQVNFWASLTLLVVLVWVSEKLIKRDR